MLVSWLAREGRELDARLDPTLLKKITSRTDFILRPQLDKGDALSLL